MNSRERKPKKYYYLKIKSWAKKHQLAIIIILSSAVLAIGFLVSTSLMQPAENLPAVSAAKKPKPKPKPAEKYYSPLTGVEVDSPEATKQAVTAVMIENSPDARPQSGLKDAGIVYEAVAEGGITRFVSLYQNNKPELIGPVRSLRIYYLDWAAPYQASIAHVGGSYNALQTVKSYRDIDQSFNSAAYWRAGDRYAPHNVYTSGAKLDELNLSKGYTSSQFEGFRHKDAKPAAEPTATSITVNLSSHLYNTSYSYDAATNTYPRSLAGAPHLDREKGQISPNSIVVIKVSAVSRGGSDGYEDIVTSGEGEGFVFQNGEVISIAWSKADRDARLKLVDEQGQEVALNRGQTWVGAITSRGGVSWQ